MNKNLMTIVLESLAFFELAGAELVDSDSAAEQMEGSLHLLETLTPEEKAEFAAFTRAYADEEEAQKGPPDRIDFFRAVPTNFGLEE